MDKFNRGEIVKEYLQEFPESPSLTLARLIYNENKEAWRDVESVRNLVRYYRGANGNVHRNHLKDRRFVREFKKDLFNPFKLPQSDEKEFEPFIIPKAQNKILLLNDIHCPYHNVEALNVAIQYGLDHKVNAVILNGDTIDFHGLSSFVKDPRKRHFKEEMDIFKLMLDALQNALPGAVFYFKQGNHEERLETYLKVKAPELYGVADFEVDALAGFGARGITYIKEKRTVKGGKLNILHGHELRGGIIPPVNPARGVFLRTGRSAIVGHFHRTSQHTDPNIDKELISCWSVGCLCELAPDYTPNNKWNHGAAIITVNEDESFNVDNFMIYGNKVYDSAGQ